MTTDAPDAPARPRCGVCGTTDHHTDRHGNIVENPARAPVPHCWAGATCLLPAGHEGPREFIPDSEIAVEFVWEEMEVEVDDDQL